MPRPRFEIAKLIAALGPSAVTACAVAEPFIGQFEVKTLESAAGSYEFQSQNAWSWENPARRIERYDENGFVADENAVARQRHALELEIGFTKFIKTRVGIELEKERLDEPVSVTQTNDYDELKLAEIGAEVIAILAPRDADGAGMGVVVEIEGPVDQEEPNHLTVGSIIEVRSGPWFVTVIPMLVHAFGGDTEAGERVDDKWDFAYATQLRHDFSERWSLALEGYGTVERLGSSGHRSDSARLFGDFDQHRVGPVLYYTHALGNAWRTPRHAAGSARLSSGVEEEETSLAIGLGLLEGLNENTPDHTLKLSIEVQF